MLFDIMIPVHVTIISCELAFNTAFYCDKYICDILDDNALLQVTNDTVEVMLHALCAYGLLR